MGELTVSEISDNQLTVDEMQRVGRRQEASKRRSETEGGGREKIEREKWLRVTEDTGL